MTEQNNPASKFSILALQEVFFYTSFFHWGTISYHIHFKKTSLDLQRKGQKLL